MVNAWSLAASILDGTLDEDYPIMTGIGTHPSGGWVDQLDFKNVSIDMSNAPAELDKPSVHFKYNEDEILKEVKDYISRTYSSHYANNGVQTLDLIDAVGDAAAFCRSNILKYASRYDKKGTTRLDIEKIIHYAVLLYHFEGLDTKDTTNGYETF